MGLDVHWILILWKILVKFRKAYFPHENNWLHATQIKYKFKTRLTKFTQKKKTYLQNIFAFIKVI